MSLLPLLLGAALAAQAQTAAQIASENVATIRKAGLALDELYGAGWTFETGQALAVAIRASAAALEAHRAKYPNPVSDAYGSGTLSNIDESVKAGIRAVRGDEEAKKANYKRGCVATREAVEGGLAQAAAQGKLKGLVIKKIYLGCGLEHHATVVFPDGVDWNKAGVVLDGWLNQSAKVEKIAFPIASWKRRFPLHRIICSTNLED